MTQRVGPTRLLGRTSFAAEPALSGVEWAAQDLSRLMPAGEGMPTYRDIYMEKEEPAPAPTLEELLRPEDEEALSLADFEDEQ